MKALCWVRYNSKMYFKDGVFMPQRAEYRNSIRSKTLIKNSLIELLKTKPLEKVTVTDIVNNADINRGTFYAHYTDICELIHAVEDEIVDTLCSFTHEWNETEPFQNPLPLFLRISDYLTRKQDLIFALMNANNTSSFVFRLPDLLTEHLLASDSVPKPLLRDPLLEARFRFYAGGAVSLYAAWFQGSLEGTLDDVAYMLEKIIIN